MKRIPQVVFGVLAFLFVLLLPLEVPLQAKQVAAVTLLMVIWWVTEAIPLEATALVPLVLFPLLGVLSPAEAAAPYADKVIFLFLGGFIIAMSMQRWNLHRRIALQIVLRVGTSPKRLVLGFMIATAFLSMWISNTATTMLMIPIALAIITTILPGGNEDGDGLSEEQRTFAACLVIAVAYAASIGGMGSIIGSPPNGIFVAQAKTLFPLAPQIDFFSWLTFGVPFIAIFIPATWLWLTHMPFRRMPRVISEAREVVRSQLNEMGAMSRGEQWTLSVFGLTAIAWIFSQTKEIGGITVPGLDLVFPGIDDSTIAIFGAILLFLLPVDLKRGIFTMDWEWAVKIPWGILILFGGGLSLSVAFIRSGLAQQIVAVFGAFEALPLILIVLAVALMIVLLSEVASNTAIASIMIPVMAVTSVGLGLNPFLLMLTAAISASLGFMLPVGTPPNAIAYGTGYLSIRQMAYSGWALDLIGVVLWTIFLFVVAMPVLGITAVLPPWAVAP